jgi:hypothetical protein
MPELPIHADLQDRFRSDERRSNCLPTRRRSSVLSFHYCAVCIMPSSGPYRDAEEPAAVEKGDRHDDNDNEVDQGDSGTTFAPIASAEIATVLEWLQNLNLQPGTDLYPTNTNNNIHTIITPERLQYITFRLLQQQCGYLYASVNTALYHEWVPYSANDFTSLMRDPEMYHDDDDDGSSCSSLQETGGDDEDDGLAIVLPLGAGGGSTSNDEAGLRKKNNSHRNNQSTTAVVLDVYRSTRTAALDDDNFVADATTPMKARGSIPARLVSNDVALITHGSGGAAHLIPPTGRAGRADTWLYVAAAVLGLGDIVIDPDHDNDDDAVSAILLKALRGCWKSAESTLPNTGLNRSPTNMIKFMDHQYVWGQDASSSCLLILPILTIDATKGWTGESYEVLILCDDDRYGRANHRQVAQRIGLTTINAANNQHAVVQSATTTELNMAVDLLSHILKFSAYALEQLPGPATPRGAALWLSYRDELEAARTLHANIVGGGNISSDQYHHKIIVPVVKHSGQMVAKVDLGAMNHNDNDDMGGRTGGRPQRGNVVVYPDPLLLAAKSSVVWTRKFAFQLLADSEPSLYDGTGHFGMDHAGGGGGNDALDEILGKNVAFGSQNDGSPTSCGDFTG